MKTRWFTCGISLGLLTSTLTLSAQDAPPAVVPAAEPPVAAPAQTKAAPTAEPTLTEKLKLARLSPAIREVVKMSDAGMDVGVIQSFVENSSTPYNLTSDDIIFLHEQGISSGVITAMLQRGARIREQIAATTPPPMPPAPAAAPAPAASVQPAQAAPTYVVQNPAPTIVDTTPTYVASSPSVIYVPYSGYYPRHYYSRPYFNFHYSTGWSSPHSYGHFGYRCYP